MKRSLLSDFSCRDFSHPYGPARTWSASQRMLSSCRFQTARCSIVLPYCPPSPAAPPLDSPSLTRSLSLTHYLSCREVQHRAAAPTPFPAAMPCKGAGRCRTAAPSPSASLGSAARLSIFLSALKTGSQPHQLTDKQARVRAAHISTQAIRHGPAP